jgi:hypothetical protein
MVVGAVLYAVFVATVTAMLTDLDPSSREYRSKLDMLNQYMQHAQLPSALRQKLRTYYQVRATAQSHRCPRPLSHPTRRKWALALLSVATACSALHCCRGGAPVERGVADGGGSTPSLSTVQPSPQPSASSQPSSPMWQLLFPGHRAFHEEHILSELSGPLTHEVRLQKCRNVLSALNILEADDPQVRPRPRRRPRLSPRRRPRRRLRRRPRRRPATAHAAAHAAATHVYHQVVSHAPDTIRCGLRHHCPPIRDVCARAHLYARQVAFFLCDKLTRVVYTSGDYVIRDGQEVVGMYFISSGCVEVVHAGEIITTLGAHSFFGEMALLNPLGEATASVIVHGSHRPRTPHAIRADFSLWRGVPCGWVVQVIVRTYLEGYLLSKSDYAWLERAHPLFRGYLEAAARLRLERSKQTKAFAEAAHGSPNLDALLEVLDPVKRRLLAKGVASQKQLVGNRGKGGKVQMAASTMNFTKKLTMRGRPCQRAETPVRSKACSATARKERFEQARTSSVPDRRGSRRSSGSTSGRNNAADEGSNRHEDEHHVMEAQRIANLPEGAVTDPAYHAAAPGAVQPSPDEEPSPARSTVTV